MPQVKCPNPDCGAVRTVVEGKKKNCRKCGAALSTIPPKPPKIVKVTVEYLQEQYPKQVMEIVSAAQTQALAEAAKEEFGELTVEVLQESYPEVIKEIVTSTRETIATEITEKVKSETAKGLVKEINKMNTRMFAEKFPKLFNKVTSDVRKAVKRENKDKS